MPAESAVTALGWEMINDLPPVFRGDPTIRAILHVQAREAERRRQYIEQVRSELIPQLAGDKGLAIYEYILGLRVQPAIPLEERRAAVLGFLRGGVSTGDEWVAALDRILPAGWSWETYLPDPWRPRNLLQNPNGLVIGDVETGWMSSATSGSVDFSHGAWELTDTNGWYSSVDNPTVPGTWWPLYPSGVAESYAAVLSDRWYSVQARVLLDSVNNPALFNGKLELYAMWDNETGSQETIKVAETPVTLQSLAAGGEVSPRQFDLKGFAQCPPAGSAPGLTTFSRVSLFLQVQVLAGLVSQIALGKLLVDDVGGPDGAHPPYGDGTYKGWVWEYDPEAVDPILSPSYQDQPAALHIRVHLPFSALDPRAAPAIALIRAITSAGDHLDFEYLPGFTLDEAHLDTDALD